MSHLPRVLSEPESAAEDVRNALAVLKASGNRPPGDPQVMYDIEDIRAVAARLESAVAKLEARRG